MDMVNFKDLDTGKVSKIPKAELAFGMVPVQMEGEEDIYWVDGNNLKRSTTLKHPHFEGELKRKIMEIQRILLPVRGMNYKEWEEPFRCDLHPEKEIELWFVLAMQFEALTKERFTTSSEKVDVYTALACVLLGAGDADVILPRLLVLNRNQAEEIITEFRRVFKNT